MDGAWTARRSCVSERAEAPTVRTGAGLRPRSALPTRVADAGLSLEPLHRPRHCRGAQGTARGGEGTRGPAPRAGACQVAPGPPLVCCECGPAGPASRVACAPPPPLRTPSLFLLWEFIPFCFSRVHR